MKTKAKTEAVAPKDKYDLEMEELLALKGADFKRAAKQHWDNCEPLFNVLNYRGELHGCLTQVKGGCPHDDEGWGDAYYSAPTPELTAAIRADPCIPSTPERITKKSLPAFAEWQRRLDAELGEGR